MSGPRFIELWALLLPLLLLVPLCCPSSSTPRQPGCALPPLISNTVRQRQQRPHAAGSTTSISTISSSSSNSSSTAAAAALASAVMTFASRGLQAAGCCNSWPRLRFLQHNQQPCHKRAAAAASAARAATAATANRFVFVHISSSRKFMPWLSRGSSSSRSGNIGLRSLSVRSSSCAALREQPPGVPASAGAAGGSTAAAAAAAAAHSLLCNRIRDMSAAYYTGEGPQVSDAVFDALWLELSNIEKQHPHLRHPDSPLRLVGSGPLPAAATPGATAAAAECQHLAPVLSLESVHSPTEAYRLFDKLDSSSAVGRKRRPKSQEGKSVFAANSGAAAAAASAASAFADEGEAAAAASIPAAPAAAPPDAFAAPLLLEPKLDGQSLSLTYALLSSSSSSNSSSNASRGNGGPRYRLVRALTRGDGRWGEDVTLKALWLAQQGRIPLEFGTPAGASAAAEGVAAGAAAAATAAERQHWPQLLEVRGEAFVLWSAFKKINEQRDAQGLKPFSSPRHAVVGLLRRLDAGPEEALRNVRFCAYGLVASSGAGAFVPFEGSSSSRSSNSSSRSSSSSETPNSNSSESNREDGSSGFSNSGSSYAAAAAAATSGAALAVLPTQQSLLQQLSRWGFEAPLRHSQLLLTRKAALAAFGEQSSAQAARSRQLRATQSEAAAAAADAPAAFSAADEELGVQGPLWNVPCDGVVFKVNLLQQQQQLGSTSRSPRWAFALKFAATAARTSVVGVQWSVGSSGVCTPVAVLQPVLLGGMTLSKASLHSLQQMQRQDVRVGDEVCVELRGHSVPQVTSVVFEARSPGSSPVTPPNSCPSCGSLLLLRAPPLQQPKRWRNQRQQQQLGAAEKSIYTANVGDVAAAAAAAAVAVDNERAADGAAAVSAAAGVIGVLWCPGGWSCGAQRMQRLRRFFSREGVAVSGLGPRALETLMARGYLRAPSDAFLLRQTDSQEVAAGRQGIAQWPGWGPQARDALFEETEEVQRKGVRLQQLLFALGVPGLGKKAAAVVAQHVRTIDGFFIMLQQLAAAQQKLGNAAQRTSGGIEEGSCGAVEGGSFDVPHQSQKTGGGEKAAQHLGVDSSVLQELRLFAADKKNREQLLLLARKLPIHPVAQQSLK